MRILIRESRGQREVALADGEHSLGRNEEASLGVSTTSDIRLELRAKNGRAVLVSNQPITIGRATFPPGVPRLWIPGEVASLGEDASLELLDEGPRDPSTVALLKGFLAGCEPPWGAYRAALICVAGTELGRCFPVPSAIMVGRGYEADVRVCDRTLSRHHARIARQSSGFTITHLGVSNETLRNGLPVHRPTDIETGDVLEMGRTVFYFHNAAEPRKIAPTSSSDHSNKPSTHARSGDLEVPRLSVWDSVLACFGVLLSVAAFAWAWRLSL